MFGSVASEWEWQVACGSRMPDSLCFRTVQCDDFCFCEHRIVSTWISHSLLYSGAISFLMADIPSSL